MTARALSLKIGRNDTLVRKILSGAVSAPRGDNLTALAREIGVAAGELMAPDHPTPAFDASEAVLPAPDASLPTPRPSGPTDVPVYGVAEGGQHGAFLVNLTQGPVDYAPHPMSLIRAQNLFAVTIQGDSMEPVWRAGDLVYCQGGRGYGPGDYVLLQLEAGPGEVPLAFVKRFVRQDNGSLVLAQHNPPTEMTVDRVRVLQVWRAFHWRELGW